MFKQCFRYLVLIEGEKQVYAFDRDNNVFQIHNITFLSRKLNRHIRDTLVDAEMIVEKVDNSDGQTEIIPRLLIYDIIAFEVNFLKFVYLFFLKNLKITKLLKN